MDTCRLPDRSGDHPSREELFLELLDVIQSWAHARGLTHGELGEVVTAGGRLAGPVIAPMFDVAMSGGNPVPVERRDETIPRPALD
jgi:hypothetical protein